MIYRIIFLIEGTAKLKRLAGAVPVGSLWNLLELFFKNKLYVNLKLKSAVFKHI